MEEVVKMKEESVAPMPNVKTTLVFNVFVCNMALTLGAVLLASIPYYDYFGLSMTREGLIITSAVGICIYIGFVFMIQYFNDVLLSVILFGFWWISFSLFIGFLSAFFYNITPIQCLLISWAQSVSIIVYIRVSSKLEWYTAASFMLTSSVLVWIMSIYSYLIENDWLYSIGVFGFALALLGYNLWQMNQIKDRFDLSWEQSIRACLFYYFPIKKN